MPTDPKARSSVNNAYIREKSMTFSYLDGWWTDAGTFESLLRAANLVAQSSMKKTLSPAEVSEPSYFCVLSG